MRLLIAAVALSFAATASAQGLPKERCRSLAGRLEESLTAQRRTAEQDERLAQLLDFKGQANGALLEANQRLVLSYRKLNEAERDQIKSLEDFIYQLRLCAR